MIRHVEPLPFMIASSNMNCATYKHNKFKFINVYFIFMLSYRFVTQLVNRRLAIGPSIEIAPDIRHLSD